MGPLEEKTYTELELRLVRAVTKGDISELMECIKDGADVRMDNDILVTVALKGPMKSSLNILEFLLGRGCDPNARCGLALKYAIHNNVNWFVETLLESGANPNIEGSEYFEYTLYAGLPLLEAVAQKDEHSIKRLLEYGADPKAQGHKAYLKACANGHTFAIQKFIEAGCEPNLSRGTPLAAAGYSEKLLIDAHIPKDLSQSEYDQFITKHFEPIKTLLDLGANPYSFQRTFVDNLPIIGRTWLQKEIQAYIDKDLVKQHGLPNGFFLVQHLSDLRKKGTLDGLTASGILHAARAGKFQHVLDVLNKNRTSDDPDQKTLYINDFLEQDEKGNCILDYLAAQGELKNVFRPHLWMGRDQDLKALYNQVPNLHQNQINIKAVISNIQLGVDTSKTRPKIRRRR